MEFLNSLDVSLFHGGSCRPVQSLQEEVRRGDLVVVPPAVVPSVPQRGEPEKRSADGVVASSSGGGESGGGGGAGPSAQVALVVAPSVSSVGGPGSGVPVPSQVLGGSGSGMPVPSRVIAGSSGAGTQGVSNIIGTLLATLGYGAPGTGTLAPVGVAPPHIPSLVGSSSSTPVGGDYTPSPHGGAQGGASRDFEDTPEVCPRRSLLDYDLRRQSPARVHRSRSPREPRPTEVRRQMNFVRGHIEDMGRWQRRRTILFSK